MHSFRSTVGAFQNCEKRLLALTCPSDRLSLCLLVCPSVYLSVCLSVIPFVRPFALNNSAPTGLIFTKFHI